MKLVRREENFLVGPELIGMNEILRLRKIYWGKFGYKPNTAKLSHNAIDSIMQIIPKETTPVPLDKIFGMDIIVDGDLQPNEWRIGYVKEMAYEVEL